MMLFVALLVSLVAGQGDPTCPTFIAQDATGSYTYNLAQFQAPDGDLTKFIQGSEGPNSWVAYLNICGNSKVVGCDSDTPICQNDNGKPPKFFSLGTSQSWTMKQYYDPLKGSASTPIASGGVSVQITNGDKCGDGTIRSAYLWFKCDPNANTLPTTVSMAEADPSNPSNPTPCIYYFSPIAYKGFCSGYGGGSDGFDYGWVFVIIVLCGLFLYFVVGIIVLKFALHKEGREIVPQADFWFALPGLVLDGLKYGMCCVPCRGSSYTTV